jgi:hypothetical protein
MKDCVAWGVAPANVLSAFARSHCKQRLVFVDFKALCGKWRLLDLIVSSGWFLWTSKLCVAMAFAGAPFPCCLSSAFSSSGGRRTLQGRRQQKRSSM